MNKELSKGLDLLMHNYIPYNQSLYWHNKSKKRVKNMLSALRIIQDNNDLSQSHPIKDMLKNLVLLFDKVDDLHHNRKHPDVTIRLNKVHTIKSLNDLTNIDSVIVNHYFLQIIRYFQKAYHKTINRFSGNLLQEIKERKTFIIVFHMYGNYMAGIYKINQFIQKLRNKFNIGALTKNVLFAIDCDLIWIEHSRLPMPKVPGSGGEKHFSLFFTHPGVIKIKKSGEIKIRRRKGELTSVNEIINHADPSLIFVVEVKRGIGDYKGAIDELVRLFRKSNMQNRLIIQSYNLHMIEYAKSKYHYIVTGLIAKHIPRERVFLTPIDNFTEYKKNYGFSGLLPSYSNVSKIVDTFYISKLWMTKKMLQNLMKRERFSLFPTHINRRDLMEIVYKGKNSAGITVDESYEDEIYKFLESII